MAFYDSMIKTFAGFFRALYRIEIVGEENIPSPDVPVLLCSNHTHAMDPVILGAALRIKIYYLTKEELFRIPLLSGLIRAFGAVPVKRGTGDFGALRKSMELLGDGKTVGIFPQGHRNPGVAPRGTEIHPGTGMIVRRASAAVLPVCIHTKDHKIRLFRKTVVVVGRLMPADSFPLPEDAKSNKENYEAITQTVFGEICAMDEKQTEEERRLLP